MDFCHWTIFLSFSFFHCEVWNHDYLYQTRMLLTHRTFFFVSLQLLNKLFENIVWNWPKCWCHGFGKQKDDFKALVNLDKTNISNKMLSCKTQQEGKQFRKNAANSPAINSIWWPYLVKSSKTEKVFVPLISIVYIFYGIWSQFIEIATLAPTPYCCWEYYC